MPAFTLATDPQFVTLFNLLHGHFLYTCIQTVFQVEHIYQYPVLLFFLTLVDEKFVAIYLPAYFLKASMRSKFRST
jgi:hypothetical protein